ncbi:MAG: ABC transporter ATP-binding protein [Thermotogaceae bacterium]|nr:ABC transporter ATP-binding protein [Thermotogaceae bacterium]
MSVYSGAPLGAPVSYRGVLQILTCKNVSKTYPNGLEALKEVSFDVSRGEIHAIVGENGAGKSTLMNILFGMIKPSSGEITFKDKPFSPKHPSEAIDLGMGMVHQHFKLVQSITVAENVVLGMENRFQNKLRKIDIAEVNRSVASLIEKLKMSISPEDRIEGLPISKRQQVEILKVLYRDTDFVILDEPTAVLAPNEVDDFLEFVMGIREMGKTVVFISHRLGEVFAIADRITILRRGRVAGTFEKKEVNRESVANMMIGTAIDLSEHPEDSLKSDVVLSVEEICDVSGTLKDLSFELHEGEILGFAGVGGNGQEELFEALAGNLKLSSGDIKLRGSSLKDHDTFGRRMAGLAYITDDRMKKGLAPDRSIIDNSIAGHHKFGKFGKVAINNSKARAFAESIIADYDVRTSKNGKTTVGALSGGNMQKLLVGREIAFEPKVLLAAQPTTGVDVAARKLIHDSFRKLSKAGSGIVLISGDLEEIMDLANRIIVLYRGRAVAEMSYPHYDSTEISYYMTGIRGSQDVHCSNAQP